MAQGSPHGKACRSRRGLVWRAPRPSWAVFLLGAVLACTSATAPQPNRPPTAGVTHDRALRSDAGGVTEMAVTASVSDPDGDPLAVQWTFGDGSGASGASASHVHAASGAYTITLSAADGRGETARAQATVVVRSMVGRWFGGSTPMVCGQDRARFDCFFESAPRVGGDHASSFDHELQGHTKVRLVFAIPRRPQRGPEDACRR